MSGDNSIRTELDEALSAWADDPLLSAPLADPARACLVLTADATRLLHASSAAEALARVVVAPDGRLAAELAAQIRAVAGRARPHVVRLRLDRRRIAPPTACLVARRQAGGEAAILVIALGPLPALRARAVSAFRPETSSAPVAAVPDTPGVPVPGDRFVWRSDAEGRITAVTGSGAALFASDLVGLRWADLAQARRLIGAEALLAAIDGRTTFRAAPAALDLGAAGRLALDLSGACLGRRGEAFTGFGGYGVVRGVTPAAEPDPQVLAPDVPAAGPVIREARPAGMPEELPAPRPGARAALARFGQSWAGAGEPSVRLAASRAFDAVSPEAASPAETADRHAVPAVVGAEEDVGQTRAVTAREAPDAALSVTEHAAFREIARALGARYAGDEEAAGSTDDGTVGGAVMPFPSVVPPPAQASGEPDGTPEPEASAARSPDAAGMAALVADLPAAILVHRGDAVLAASRTLLVLTGHADLASLREAGLAHLFRGLPPGPSGEGAPVRTVPIDVGGGSRPVAVDHGRIAWDGGPAECLVLRPIPETPHADVAAAERAARAFHNRHVADAHATLDALDDGVVTLDAEARVVAMNRAAAALFACDPREVVGTNLDALFAETWGEAVRAALAEPGVETGLEIGGRRLSLRVTGGDGIRAAVLRSGVAANPPEVRGSTGSAFLGRLDREIRAPVESVVGLADGLLSAPHGPIDERDRAALRAIRAAGGHLTGLVADLLDLAAIESGGRALAVRPLPLNDLVSACVELLQAEASRARIVLRTSFSPDLAPLEADEPTMRQAALTVIGSAIRTTGAGGQVIVSTTPGESGGVALKVRGTGPGMGRDEVEHALEPLAAGTVSGLGLPLTKALVEANRGRLRVSSRKDEGTLVEILLPGLRARSA